MIPATIDTEFKEDAKELSALMRLTTICSAVTHDCKSAAETIS